ncbi:MAG: hypothetical protein Q9190_004356 [Brigantiaea leucoxantha]
MERMSIEAARCRPLSTDTPTLLEERSFEGNTSDGTENVATTRSRVLNGGRLLATYTLAEIGELKYTSEITYRSLSSTGDDYQQLDVLMLNNFKEATKNELECQVCYALMLDPLTTNCGHTFCRKCVARVLDHSSLCPICRRTLSTRPGAVNERSNQRLTKLLLGLCPELVAARQEAMLQEEQRMSGETNVPLFPCTLAYPSMPLFLHIFEPRYRLMIRRAIESGDRKFGILMYNARQEPQGDLGVTHFMQYGTVSYIRNMELLPDGRSLIENVGVSRFRVKDWTWLDGYAVANVERIEDISTTEEEEIETRETSASPPPTTDLLAQLDFMSNVQLLRISTDFIVRMRAASAPWLHERVTATYGSPPDDPALFPYWFASVLPISQEEKYRLLPTRSVRERLKITARWAAAANAKAPQPESQSMLRRKTYEAHKTSVISKKSTSTKGLDLGISTEASPLLKKSHLAKELQFLQDPLRLAENTVSLLQRNEYDKSLEIVRLASKDISCTVSWNHLINYDMSKGDIRKAHKLYLEMKKRAQQPDAYTFTILLRGFSRNKDKESSLALALKVYHSMFAENCPVKPNIVHTNAVLQACALSLDADALWSVAAKLPQRGPGAPTNFTFTTILNAIRTMAWHSGNDLPDQGVEETSVRRQEAVMQGRRIWEEVVGRWRAGDMLVDEELVCSMGRLLLLGSVQRDHADVLFLAEQVMGIPRPKGSRTKSLPKAEEAPHITRPQNEEDGGDHALADPSATTSPAHLDEPSETSPSSTKLTEVFQPSPSKDPSGATARPGRNTISLLVSACINLRRIPWAQYYWGLLTSPNGPYKLDPDNENYHMYLRLLRLQHNSRLALQLVQDLVSKQDDDDHNKTIPGENKGVAAKTFRIALSCCVRDKNNPDALNHASELLSLMIETLPYPDLKCLDLYLALTESMKRDWKAVWFACQQLEQPMVMLKKGAGYGFDQVAGGDDVRERREKREVERLVKKYAAALHSVLDLGKEELGMDKRGRKEAMRLVSWAQSWVQKMKWSGGGGFLSGGDRGAEDEAGKREARDGGGKKSSTIQYKGSGEREETKRKLEGGWKKRMHKGGRAVRKKFDVEELRGFE